MTSRINVKKKKTKTFQMKEISKFKFVHGQKKKQKKKQEINQRLNIEIFKMESYAIKRSQKTLAIGLVTQQGHALRSTKETA